MAIASVVLYHLHGFVAQTANADPRDSAWSFIGHGYRGVNLFYVLSGFILGLPFASHYLLDKAPVRLSSYFLRRITRLEPPYILNLLICFALLVLARGESAQALLPHLGASALYMHNLWFGQQSTINPVAWTLEIEVQFYCLVPLLARVFAVRPAALRRTVIAAVILLAGISQVFCWEAPPRARLSILYAIQFFLAGFLLADIYVVDWKEQPSSHWLWDLVSLAFWPVLFLLGDKTIWILFPLIILVVYVAAFKGIVFKTIFRNPVITIIGGMCYSIYLLHYQLIPWVLDFSRQVGFVQTFDSYFTIQLMMYMPILVLISCLYYVLVERPCMARDWPRQALASLRSISRIGARL